MLTIDLHAAQIQGFFDIPLDNLFAGAGLRARTSSEALPTASLMIVSPDVGGVVRARAIAKRLDADLAIIDKRRERAGVSEVMNIIGDVKTADCILIDDIVDSAGTLCNAAVALMDAGRQVGVRLCHARRAVGRRGGAGRGVAASRSGHHRQHPGDRGGAGVAATSGQLSIAPLMAEAMRRISEETSVSSLFD